MKSLEAYVERYTKMVKWFGCAATVEGINQAIVDVLKPVMTLTMHPMLLQELLMQKATEFFEHAAENLDWSPAKLSKRLLEVKLEIDATNTYRHTSEELEIGARLCWRNSVKCIGRVAWKTLLVRDCRHVATLEEIIRELEKHVDIATAGTSVQSVMTVFRPKQPDEPWGIKFWSDQFVRYACYTDKDGNTIGDVANKHFTEYLVDHGLWTPPKKRTQHDVLPFVIKMPGSDKPTVHQFDSKSVHEVKISHPKYPNVTKVCTRLAHDSRSVTLVLTVHE